MKEGPRDTADEEKSASKARVRKGTREILLARHV